MQIRKSVAAVAAMLVLAAFVFVGCQPSTSNNTQPGTDTNAQPAAEKVTFKLAGYGDNSNPEGQTLEKIVKSYQEKYPNVTVEWEMLYDEAYHQKIRARLAAKDVPHVGYMWPEARGQYWRDAGQMIDMRKYKADFPDLQWDKFTPQDPSGSGAINEIPLGPDNVTSVLFMNTALLKELGLSEPATYEDLKKMVPIAKGKGIEVVAMAGQEGWVWNSCLLSMIVGRISGDPQWVSKAVAGQAKFTDAAFLDSIKFVKTMLDDGVIDPKQVIGTDYGTAPTKFLNKKALFLLDGQWRAGALVTDKAVADQTKVVLFPAIPGEKLAASTSAAVSIGYGLTLAAEQAGEGVVRASLDFLKVFYTVENCVQRWKDGAILAPLVNGFTVPADAENLPKEKVILVQERIKTMTQVIDSWLQPPKGNDALNAGLQAMATGKKTPEEICAEVEGLARK